jgi:O-antigen ligase
LNTEIIKLLGPFLGIIIWYKWTYSFSFNNKLKLAGLFLTSFVLFASNFVFIYRALHQIIQIFLIILFIVLLNKRNYISKVIFPFFIFTIFILISLINQKIDQNVTTQLINYFIIILVTNFLFIAIKNVSDIKIFMHLLAQLSIFCSITGLIEFFMNPVMRIEAYSSNANYFALFLGIGFCVILSEWKSKYKYIYLFIIFITILISGSRAPLIFILIHILIKAYKNKKLILTLISFFILFILLNFLGLRQLDKDSTEGSNLDRIALIYSGLKMVEEHPISGVGWGRFGNEIVSYSGLIDVLQNSNGETVDLSTQEGKVSHNDFLRIVTELGLPCLVLVLYWLISIFLTTLKNNSYNLEFLLPIWVGILFFSFTHNNLNNSFFWYIFLLPYQLKNKYNLVNLKIN